MVYIWAAARAPPSALIGWGFPTGAAAAARSGARAPEAGCCTTRAGDGGGGRELGSPRCAAGSKLTASF